MVMVMVMVLVAVCDGRAAAWRGDAFENRASKNYEVSACARSRLASRDSALQVKAAVLSDAFTLLGFKAQGAAECGREG